VTAYQINDIYYTVQGEGKRAGNPSLFVRFSGCNQTCMVETHNFDCDTEFVSGRKLTGEEIAAELVALNSHCQWVVCTGGEPGLQLDRALVDLFHTHCYQVAIETNGSIEVDGLGLDWITVSPKVAEHAIRQRTASEVKYVRGYGQAIPKTVVMAQHYLISPAFDGDMVAPRTLAWCIQLVKDNPQWSLSVQQHKMWNVR
jgi:7-carboxy-7-deazaguanine synthase